MEKQCLFNSPQGYAYPRTLLSESKQQQLAVEIAKVTQLLHAVKMNLQWFNRKFCDLNQQFNTPFQQMMEAVDLAVKSTYQIEFELWPKVLKQLGFIFALEHQLSLFQESSQHTFIFYSNIKFIPSDINNNVDIFRQFQELLSFIVHETNIQQTIFEIQITNLEGELSISIADILNNLSLSETLFNQIRQHIKQPLSYSLTLDPPKIMMKFQIIQ